MQVNISEIDQRKVVTRIMYLVDRFIDSVWQSDVGIVHTEFENPAVANNDNLRAGFGLAWLDERG